ncbi:MAG TPA: RidA family protein [Thermoanaerobaculia bacterium]|jgi:2-iminobutanoate/2-iminopropanoate deaminase|nr:RidA family protein [Thermoanaerobaculia bacterium]
MQIEPISTGDAPAAIGPYSQGIKANGFVYTSGQIPLDPATSDLVGGSFEDQVHRVFKNLQAILAAAGTDLSRVVKATVYVTDLKNFGTLNSIYESYFGSHKPARTTVEVPALPKNATVEIDLIALA